jgi:hypothetical protein
MSASLAVHVADPLHNLSEASKKIHVCIGTLRGWCLTGRVNHYRIGNRIMIAQSDLDAFLRSTRVEAK